MRNRFPCIGLRISLLFVLTFGVFCLSQAAVSQVSASSDYSEFDLYSIERPRILGKAAGYLGESPRTVTADIAERSLGGPHDFFSEGDYWWPNPDSPNGPYIRRDGESNPENFVAHRHSMVRFSDIIGTLVSAYILTNDEKYALHAVTHLRAWFVNSNTRMNPNLLFGQAITGLHSGRSIGIIDTIHLVEVARSAKLLNNSPSFPKKDQTLVKAWFSEYLNWLNTHEYGLKEKVHPNNHGVTWSMQAAAFADLVSDEDTLIWVRNQFKSVYIGEMMDSRGGFPKELARTKPYAYSLFVIDAMAGVAQIASTEKDNLWQFRLKDGRGMQRGLAFIAPYIKSKHKWTLAPDVEYWEEWPVRHPSLLFAGFEFNNNEYLKVWANLEPDPDTFEVLRNFPLRHPLLWVKLN